MAEPGKYESKKYEPGNMNRENMNMENMNRETLPASTSRYCSIHAQLHAFLKSQIFPLVPDSMP